MIPRPILILFLLIGINGPLYAESDRPYLSTEAGLSFTDAAPDGAVGTLVLTIAEPPTDPLGLEAGIFAYLLADRRPHETYIALAWDRRVRLGILRPAYDGVLPSVYSAHTPFLAYTRAEYASAYVTIEGMRRNAVPWGMSVEDANGRLTWAVSAHKAVKGGFRDASVAVGWQQGATQIAAAAEGVWDQDAVWKGSNAKVGVGYATDRAGAHLAYLHPEVNLRPDAVSADIWHDIGPNWTLFAFGTRTVDGQDDAGGIALKRGFGLASDVSLAAASSREGNTMHFGLVRRF